MSLLWNRKAALSFGPKGKKGVKVQDLRISFEIEKSGDSNANTAKIQVYNLNETSKGILKTKDDSTVSLEVGYGDILEQLFIGDITRSFTQRSGADFITTIEAGEGDQSLTKATLDKSYEAGTSEKTIVQDALDSMKKIGGLIIGTIEEVKDDIIQNGLSVSGTAKSIVDKITTKQSLEFSIQDNKSQILPPEKDTGESAVVLTPSTGLIGSPSIGLIGKKATKEEGIEFKALIQTAKIRPGRLVKIISRDIEGFFKVEKARFTGDTHSPNWFVLCEAKL